MEVRKQNSLSEYVRKECMLILANGVQPSMRLLTRYDLCEMLHHELRYMAASQQEADAAAVIEAVVEENLDRWIQLYIDRPPYGAFALKPIT